MSGVRMWSPEDRTGGPIDSVFDDLRLQFRDLVIERLVGTYPADDDNVFWLSLGRAPALRGEETVQVDTYPEGRPPFLLEGERELAEHVTTEDSNEAFSQIAGWLRRRSTEDYGVLEC